MNNSIFYFFYNLSSNTFIAKTSLFLSYPFTYIGLFLVLIWALFFSKNKFFNFSLLFLSGFFSWFISTGLKNIFQTSRPFVNMNIIPLYKESSFSFPSDHMSLWAAIAVSMFLINKRAGIIFSIFAILVGFSRIIIGVHYPIDVLGGLIIGVFVGLILIKVFKKV